MWLPRQSMVGVSYDCVCMWIHVCDMFRACECHRAQQSGQEHPVQVPEPQPCGCYHRLHRPPETLVAWADTPSPTNHTPFLSYVAAISVYLVDVVTGGVVFHTSHKAALCPVQLVHSENWIVVSLHQLAHTLQLVTSICTPTCGHSTSSSTVSRGDMNWW